MGIAQNLYNLITFAEAEGIKIEEIKIALYRDNPESLWINISVLNDEFRIWKDTGNSLYTGKIPKSVEELKSLLQAIKVLTPEGYQEPEEISTRSCGEIIRDFLNKFQKK